MTAWRSRASRSLHRSADVCIAVIIVQDTIPGPVVTEIMLRMKNE